MKRIFGIIFIIALVATGSAYFHFSNLMQIRPMPKHIQQAENALAMKGIVILGHINTGYIAKLENKIYGKNDPSPLIGKGSTAPDFLNALQSNGIDIRKQLDHILGAVYATPQINGGTVLLFGTFQTEQIIKSLKQTYIVLKHDNNNIITFVRKNKETCKLSEPIQINVAQNRIILATPSIMPIILERLNKKAVADIDLTEWRKFREPRMASIEVISPENSSKALPNGFMQQVIDSAIRTKMSVISNIFIGASAKLSYDESIVVDAVLNTDDSKWVTKNAKTITDARKKFRNKVASTTPSLRKLEKYLSVQTTEKQLHLSLILNRQTLDDISNAVQEIISSFFSNMGLSVNFNVGEKQDEIIPAKDLPQFFNNYTHKDITNYTPGSYHFIKEDAVSGPFGIMLEKISLIDKANQKVAALTFKVESEPLRNIPIDNMYHDNADGAAATFRITGIYDSENRPLMAREDCGPDRNNEAAGLYIRSGYAFKDGNNISYNYLEGTKTVRLRAGVNTNNIASIRGDITLALPTDIKIEKLEWPLLGKMVQTKNARLFFRKHKSNELHYEISGQKNHILAVQALNKAGLPLKKSSSSASTSMFSNGLRNINHDISGTVSGAEVTYTTNTVSKKYDFNISSFLNHYDQRSWGKKPIVVKTDKKANFSRYIPLYNFSNFCDKNKATVALPPFRICLDSVSYFGKNWGVDARFSIAAPYSPALNQNIFGTEIRIDKLKTKTLNNRIELIDFPMRGYMLLTHSGKKKNRRAFLKAEQQIVRAPDTQGLLENKKIIGLTGKLLIRLPKSLKSRGIYAKLLNSNMITDDKRLVLVVTEIGHNSITLKAAGDVGKLIQIIPISTTKKPLPLNNIEIKEKDGVYMITLYPVGGTPEFLNVIYANKQEKFAIPFHIISP